MRKPALIAIAMVLAGGCRSLRAPGPPAPLREQYPVAFYAREFVELGQASAEVQKAIRRGTLVDRDRVALALTLLADAGNPAFTKDILPLFARLLERDDHAVVGGRVVCPALRIVHWMYWNTTAALALDPRAQQVTTDGPFVPHSPYAFLPDWAAAELWAVSDNPEEWAHLWARLRGDAGRSPAPAEPGASTTFADERDICIGFCRATAPLAFFDQRGTRLRVRMYYHEGHLRPWVDRTAVFEDSIR